MHSTLHEWGETVNYLFHKAKIETILTKTGNFSAFFQLPYSLYYSIYLNLPNLLFPVWQRLEEGNPKNFKAYHLRLALKAQITRFNELLEKQVDLMSQTGRWLPLSTSTNGSQIHSSEFFLNLATIYMAITLIRLLCMHAFVSLDQNNKCYWYDS